MASFFSDLVNSIFTPGPTPSIVIATNASFAALQVVLLLLLVATYSVHFIILSFLSASLWYAINWFVRELEAANAKEKESVRMKESQRARESDVEEVESGDETEAVEEVKEGRSKEVESGGFLSSGDRKGELRKRRSVGEASSGDLSTDSEWDKVEDEGDIGRTSQ